MFLWVYLNDLSARSNGEIRARPCRHACLVYLFDCLYGDNNQAINKGNKGEFRN